MRTVGRRPRAEGGVSLFPFLAVLLCTMGALIVLLIRWREAVAGYAERRCNTEIGRNGLAPFGFGRRGAPNERHIISVTGH